MRTLEAADRVLLSNYSLNSCDAHDDNWYHVYTYPALNQNIYRDICFQYGVGMQEVSLKSKKRTSKTTKRKLKTSVQMMKPRMGQKNSRILLRILIFNLIQVLTAWRNPIKQQSTYSKNNIIIIIILNSLFRFVGSKFYINVDSQKKFLTHYRVLLIHPSKSCLALHHGCIYNKSFLNFGSKLIFCKSSISLVILTTVYVSP